MPELPEVETIRIGLQKYLVGHRIEDIEIRLPKMVSGQVQKVQGAKVQDIRRFGKGLVIDLDNDYSIAIHIKMTGQLIYVGIKVPKGTKVSEKVGGKLPNAHTHVIFKLSDRRHPGKVAEGDRIQDQTDSGVALSETEGLPRMTEEGAVLYYNDIRQFGWIKIVKTAEVPELPFFKELGPEPPVVPQGGTMEGQAILTLEMFAKILRAVKKAPIKSVLMDQKKIGGIGNIYANDALFQSRIHPKRLASSLTDKETEALFIAIETVMKKGLKVGGASEWQYVNALGQTGNYQRFFQVYGQDGKPCPVCGTKIVRMILSGRGTFICEQCQK
ncbi:MAG: bifunctional DNA-formamidopyrimidine glycosylase/DNA-(apurinic or apyrimidinic site) lyase [Candidatus Levybacteria bacterium]|nr:bifunctional DNA-formamidopyrimidine glycosylase/DNA-(apurinic or apyrimidinic site) lyase [Candidatus Levybacteria bacterium]